MTELYDKSIEKLTAAQIRGFESVEALHKRYRLERSKDRPKNVLVELLKLKGDEAADPQMSIDLNSTELKEQLQKRREDQQEVLTKVFRSKLDFPEEDLHHSKFQLPTFKKAKSTQGEESAAPLQRVASFPSMEPNFPRRVQEELKQEHVSLADSLGEVEKLATTKMPDILKNVETYYEATVHPKPVSPFDFLSDSNGVHPSISDIETGKLMKFAELEVL